MDGTASTLAFGNPIYGTAQPLQKDKDFTQKLGAIIRKYFHIYYQKDTQRDKFEQFISNMGPVTNTTASGNELPDEKKSVLDDLVTDLIGKTDLHSRAVFDAFKSNIAPANTRWNDFNLYEI